jgi:hypothetical protein
MADFVATAEIEINASPAQVYELEKNGDKTHLSLSQDRNGSEQEAEHAKGMWEMMLAGLKEVVEGG